MAATRAGEPCFGMVRCLRRRPTPPLRGRRAPRLERPLLLVAAIPGRRPRLRPLREKVPVDEILRLAASLEVGSEHPLASAIIAGAKERGLEIEAASEFRSITGKGVTGTVQGRPVALGNQKLFEELCSCFEARASGW